MKELIDLTDKLVKKHSPLTSKNTNNQRDRAHSDYFCVFFITFSLILLALEPLFMFIWQFI
jgi:hypothetical protein